MKDWFLRFSLREQLLLIVMAVAVSAYLLVALVLLPLERGRDERRARNDATAEALGRVDVMVTQIQALRNSQRNASPGASGNLTALLNRTANRQGLEISRVQPNSRGAVQLRFEAAPLEALLRWVHRLEATEGLTVEELSMSQTSSAGIVSASLRVTASS